MKRFLLTAGMLSTITACAHDPICGELTIYDSHQYTALIHELTSNSIEYSRIRKQTIAYPCSSEQAVKAAQSKVLGYFSPGCGGAFYDAKRHAQFREALINQKIEFWEVNSDDGLQINCNSKDQERVSELFQKVMRQ